MSESALFGIIGEILGIPQVDRNASFVALGGDSMSAITVVRRLQRTTGIELDGLDLLSCDSLAELSDSMADLVDGADPAPTDIPEKG